jgi:hypothetical protein
MSQYKYVGNKIQMQLVGGHLIYSRDDTREVYLDKHESGSNKDTRKCCIQGDLIIL